MEAFLILVFAAFLIALICRLMGGFISSLFSGGQVPPSEEDDSTYIDYLLMKNAMYGKIGSLDPATPPLDPATPPDDEDPI